MMVRRRRAVLVTGQPSCGKTTLVRQLFERAQSRGGDALNITGFVTDEALTKGHRTGFDVVTVPTGNRGVLARHGLKSKHKTGAYRSSSLLMRSDAWRCTRLRLDLR